MFPMAIMFGNSKFTDVVCLNNLYVSSSRRVAWHCSQVEYSQYCAVVYGNINYFDDFLLYVAVNMPANSKSCRGRSHKECPVS